jgi:hypothetical protein
MANISNIAMKFTGNASQLVKELMSAEKGMQHFSESAKKMAAAQQAIENAKSQLSTEDRRAYNNAEKFQKQLDEQDAQSLKKSKKRWDERLNFVTGFAAAIAAIGIGYGIKKIHDELSEIEGISKTSRLTGASTEGITALQHGMEVLAGDAKEVAPALQKMNEFINDAATGGIDASDVFKRLGLNINMLRGMKADEAFTRIGQALVDLHDPAKQAAIATQIWGNKAAILLPLLLKGKAGIADFRDEAKKLGLLITDTEANAIESMNAFVRMRGVLEGLARQVAVQLIPMLLAFIDSLKNLKGELTAGDIVGGIISVIQTGIGYAVKAWYGLKAIVWEVIEAIERGLKNVLLLFAAILKAIAKTSGNQEFINAYKEAILLVWKLDDAIQDSSKNATQNWLSMALALMGVDKWFDSIRKKAKEIADRNANERNPGGAVTLAAKQAALFQKGQETIRNTATPLQTFESNISSLNEQLKSGAITWDTYAKAAGAAVNQLEQANQLTNLSLPNPLQAGTVASQSAITKAQNEMDVRFKESPQDRVNRVLEQSRQIQQQQLEYQRKIADAVKANPKFQVLSI